MLFAGLLYLALLRVEMILVILRIVHFARSANKRKHGSNNRAANKAERYSRIREFFPKYKYLPAERASKHKQQKNQQQQPACLFG